MSGESGYHANLHRGILLRDHGRFQEASEFFGYAIEADPNAPDSYYHQAICYCNWGRNRDSLHFLKRARSLDPVNANYPVLHAWILANRPFSVRKVLALLDEALALDPGLVTVHITKARLYRASGQWGKSELAAREALRLDPLNDYAGNLLALALREQGRSQESREVIEQILARVPNDAFGHANAGWTALQTGEHQRAYRHFLEALRIDSHETLALAGLPHALIQRAWTYRLQFWVRVFLLRQPTWRKMLILTVAFALPLFAIPVVTSDLSSQNFQIALDVILTLGTVGLVIVLTRRRGNLCLLSHPLLMNTWKPQDRIAAAITFLQFVFIIFAMAMTGAWLVAIVAFLMIASVIYSIRGGNDVAGHA